MPNAKSRKASSIDGAESAPSVRGIDSKLTVVEFQPSEDQNPISFTHSGAIKESGPDSRVVCFLDRVAPEGYIEGWARDESSHSPCVLQILQNRTVISEAIADSFRQDLLEAGVGHGHYAFYARIHDARPGECELEVVEKHSGAAIGVSSPTRHVIPVLGKSDSITVRDILRRRRWTANDLVQQIGCLQLLENLRFMGPYRFVDVTYMFLLNHWMGETGLRYVRQLEGGIISPEECFREIAFSDDQISPSRGLDGPFDGRFPYRIV